MSYRGLSEFTDGAKRAARLTFDFSGRSSRTELIGYYAVSLAVVIVVSAALAFGVEPERGNHFLLGLGWLLQLPLLAGFARRLHDQDRTGKLGWLLLPPTGLQLAGDAASLFGGTHARIKIDQVLAYAYWPGVACAIAALLLFVMPGSVGPNRFGSDPRGRE